MNIFQVYKGNWALTPEGSFKEDPWFVVGGNEVLDMGFGRPPKEFFTKRLSDGVLLPGLVNAHCQLEMSALKERFPTRIGALGVEQRREKTMASADIHQRRRAALEEVKQAFNRGTFFYNDVSRDPEFSDFLRSINRFQGNRFIEVTGSSEEEIKEQTLQTVLAMDDDGQLLPTPHSIYMSAPGVLQFIREKARFTSMSIHVLEAQDEFDYPFEKGALYKGLKKSGDYVRHSEMYHTRVLPFLHGMGMLSFKKLMLVGLTYANNFDVEFLSEEVPHSSWVFCHRTEKFLGEQRKNLPLLHSCPLRFLIGTGSPATAGDASVLDELRQLLNVGDYRESELLYAATFAAYEYLEIHPSRVPYFLFPGCEPTIESLATVKKAHILRG